MGGRQKTRKKTCRSCLWQLDKQNNSCMLKSSEIWNYFSASHWRADIQPLPGKQGLSMCSAYLWRQTPSPGKSPLLPPCPEPFLLRYDVPWYREPLGSIWVCCPGGVPCQPLASPRLWAFGREVERKPWCSASSATAKTLLSWEES